MVGLEIYCKSLKEEEKSELKRILNLLKNQVLLEGNDERIYHIAFGI